ncbi:hypothetical protein Tco_0593024 [Tanacetum coccineum]
MDKGSLCCSFINHLATPGQFSCLRSLSHQDVCDRANVAVIQHITLFFEIWLRLEHAVLSRGKLERRLVYHDAALEKRDTKIERLQKLLIEKPSREMARLRLEGDNLSTINAKYQDLLREKDQLELCNASLQGQVNWEAEVKAEFDRKFEAHQRRFDERVAVLDACLDKMDKERDEEFSPMLRDVKKTKEFLIGKVFRGWVRVCSLGLYKMRPGLPQILASGETSSAGGGAKQFIIAPSVPYVGDAGATSTKLTSMDGVSFVDSNLDVLAGTAPNYDVVATLSSALEVSTFGPSTLVIPTSSPF